MAKSFSVIKVAVKLTYKNMETKKWFRSKEVWVLGVAVLMILSKFLELDFGAILNDSSAIYIAITPLIAIILRLFNTKTKLAL